MEFRLAYRGDLKSNGNPADKQKLRRCFHRQLEELWNQQPLANHRELLSLDRPNGILLRSPLQDFQFVPLVSQRLRLICKLKILILRPEAPGALITQGGDIDNRLKTLLDSLKMPKLLNEIPKADTPQPGEVPFFCLLEDDNLITEISVTTDRLLEKCESRSEVILIIHVRISPTERICGNLGLV